MAPLTTKILHLSDIHFGRIDESVLDKLKTFIITIKDEINLVIITGDLTQRAKKGEFLSARALLESLHCPVVVVPGNHDVPLYNIFLRFFAPYLKFTRFLGSFAQTFYENDQLAVYGLWSTNNLSVKDGRITSKDLADLQDKFRNIKPEKIKIIASHHGIFSTAEPMKGKINEVLSVNPHILLSGHEHQSGVTQLPSQKFPLIISAGTSTSNRTRKETNSFNIITLAPHESITVETYIWDEGNFKVRSRFET